MKIFITGALGHIGSRLIRDLPFAFPGCEIVMLDTLLTQHYCSLFNLPREGKYHFVEGDVLDFDLVPLFKSADVVVHLAAITNAPASFGNPEEVEKVNFEGTKRVAETCLTVGSALFFPSTTSVYGTQAELVDEDCLDLKPQSPYADSKLKAENFLQQMGKQKGLRFVICRLGTICGLSPGMRFHTAINRFCWQATMGLPITIWRTALHQKRPYLSLSDAVGAMEFIVAQNIFNHRVYNILTANLTPHDIVSAIQKRLPDACVNFTDSPVMNQLSYEVDRRRFEGLGFQFSSNIESDIADTLILLNNTEENNGKK